MRKLIAVMLLVLGTSSVSMAASWTVPEVDPTSSMAAMALLAGAVLVIRGRRKK
jgi:hypothetical protein